MSIAKAGTPTTLYKAYEKMYETHALSRCAFAHPTPRFQK